MPSPSPEKAVFEFRIKDNGIGMNGHLAKPYDIKEIMRTLSDILLKDKK